MNEPVYEQHYQPVQQEQYQPYQQEQPVKSLSRAASSQNLAQQANSGYFMPNQVNRGDEIGECNLPN